MNAFRASLAFFCATQLAACGGGGGGSEPVAAVPGATTPVAVVVTESTATAVGGHALDTAQNASGAQGGVGLVTGVQIEANEPKASSSALLSMVNAVRTAMDVAATRDAVLATGVTVTNQSAPCPLGGAMVVNGLIASASGFRAGDSLDIATSNCRLSVGGATSSMDGRMNIRVTSGGIFGTLPAKVVMSISMTNLLIQEGSKTVEYNGDQSIDLTLNSTTSQSLVATGVSFSSKVISGGSSSTTTWKNYRQTLSISGISMASTVSANVETDSVVLGARGGSYTLNTPIPVVWSSTSGTPSSGAVKVIGANNSQLVATVGANGSVAIQIDANGDGSFEKTVSSTVAALKAAL